MYEEQCPKCFDFWQISLEDTLLNQRYKSENQLHESLL